MKKIDWKAVIKRAGMTFVEGFTGSIIANLTVLQVLIEDKTGWEMTAVSVVVGAIAAGVSAVWNTVITPLLQIENIEEGVEE